MPGPERYRRFYIFCDPLAHLLPFYVPALMKGLWGVATDMCNCSNTELIEINGSTGDIYYCRHREKLGNIRDGEIKELWENHPLLKKIRQREPSDFCKDCPVWNECLGGCPAIKGLTGEGDRDCPREYLYSISKDHTETEIPLWEKIKKIYTFLINL